MSATPSSQSQSSKRYPCEYPGNPCGETFARTNDRATHYRVDHEDLMFECPTCQQQFKQRRHLDDHMPVHTGEYKYRCDQCEYGTKSAARLESHKLKHTKNEPFTELDDGTVECNTCKKVFGNKKKFRDHASRVDCRKYAQFTCPIPACRAPCHSLRAVKLHLAEKHKDTDRKAAMKKVEQQMAAYEASTRNEIYTNTFTQRESSCTLYKYRYITI